MTVLMKQTEEKWLCELYRPKHSAFSNSLIATQTFKYSKIDVRIDVNYNQLMY